MDALIAQAVNTLDQHTGDAERALQLKWWHFILIPLIIIAAFVALYRVRRMFRGFKRREPNTMERMLGAQVGVYPTKRTFKRYRLHGRTLRGLAKWKW